jgi:hypothetical protein
MTAVLAAAASVVLAALLALAGYAGSSVLLAAAALVVVVVAIGWPALLQLPDARGTSLAIALTGWAAVAVAWLSEWQPRPLANFAVVVAFAVLAAFAHELLRRDGRPRLVESVTGTLSGQVSAVLAAGWVLLLGAAPGEVGVLVTAVAVGASRLVASLPLPDRAAGWTSLAFGAAAGSTAAFLLAEDGLQACVAAAIVVAGVVAGFDRLLAAQTRTPERGSTALLAAAAAPVSSVGMVAYTVIRLVAG